MSKDRAKRTVSHRGYTGNLITPRMLLMTSSNLSELKQNHFIFSLFLQDTRSLWTFSNLFDTLSSLRRLIRVFRIITRGATDEQILL